MFGPEAVQGPFKIVDSRLVPILSNRIVAEWRNQSRAWIRTRTGVKKGHEALEAAWKSESKQSC